MNERVTGAVTGGFSESTARFTGVVMRSTGSWYTVRVIGLGVGDGDVTGDGAGGGDGDGNWAGGVVSLAAGGVISHAAGAVFKARVRGRLRLSGARSTNPVVVGDRVQCSVTQSAARPEVWIEEVMPRENYIIRRASNLSRESHIIAANIDQAIVVATLFSPTTALEFIDRFLVTCEAYRIPAAIVLNKIDLTVADWASDGASDGGLDDAGNCLEGGVERGVEGGVEGGLGYSRAVRDFVEIYRLAGYRVILTSAVNGLGISELREFLRGRTTLVSGNSGVGKSTLIGAVSPGLDIRVGEISRAHSKGMHTTTFSQMYALFEENSFQAGEGGDGDGNCDGGGDGDCDCDCDAIAGTGGYIIDTPGIKGFGLVDIDAGELYHFFPDLMRESTDCQYYNCTHTHEPGCAVIRAVEEGRIAPQRYMSYLKMLEDGGKYR